MSKVIEIPGGTATLRERPEVRTRHQQLVEAASIAASSALAKVPSGLPEGTDDASVAARTEALAGVNFTMEEGLSLMQLKNAVIVALLESWTLPGPVPTMATIGDVDPEVYAALEKETNALGAANEALASVNFEPTPKPDPESPFLGSGSSDGLSKSEVTSLSIVPPQLDGESTATARSTPA